MRQKFEINWAVLLHGLDKGWLGYAEALKYILESRLADELDSDTIANLYINEGNVDYMHQFIKSRANENEENYAIRQWSAHFLNRIEDSNLPINAKLQEIANVWADFNYPEEWSKFIYYMPSKENSSPDEVYNSFVKFLNGLDNNRG